MVAIAHFETLSDARKPWESLAGEQRTCLTMLAVFGGFSFDLHAAAAVLDIAPVKALRTLQRFDLQAAPSASFPDDRRYCLPQRTQLRAGLELQQLPFKELVEARFVRYFSEFARTSRLRYENGGVIEALEGLRRNRDHLLQAGALIEGEQPETFAQIVLATHVVDMGHGMDRRHLERLRRAHEATRELNQELNARCSIAISEVLQRLGNTPAALHELESSAVSKGYTAALRSRIALAMSSLHLEQRRPEEARRHCDLGLGTESGRDSRLEAALLGVRAMANAAMGGSERTLNDFEIAMAVQRRAGHLTALGSTALSKGEAHIRLGELEEALACFDVARVAGTDISDQHQVALAECRLGAAKRDLGSFAEAERHLQTALELTEPQGRSSLARMTWRELGLLRHEQGRLGAARGCYLRAHDPSKDASGLAPVPVYTARGLLELDSWRLEHARSEFAEARRLAVLGTEKRDLLLSHLCLAAVLVFCEESSFARRLVKDAREMGDTTWLAEPISRVVETLETAARSTEARSGRPPLLDPVTQCANAELRALARVMLRHWRKHQRRVSRNRDGESRDLKIDLVLRTARLGGKKLRLRHRRALWRILLRLARAEGNRVVSANELVAEGWRGERIDEKAAAARLYFAVYELRRLGLKGVILTSKNGYVISDEVRIVIKSSTT